jgi:hypothetical protein
MYDVIHLCMMSRHRVQKSSYCIRYGIYLVLGICGGTLPLVSTTTLSGWFPHRHCFHSGDR